MEIRVESTADKVASGGRCKTSCFGRRLCSAGRERLVTRANSQNMLERLVADEAEREALRAIMFDRPCAVAFTSAAARDKLS